MKKAIFAAFTAVVLVSCGGAQQEESKVDSVQVVDSSITANDSTVAQISGNDSTSTSSSNNEQLAQ